MALLLILVIGLAIHFHHQLGRLRLRLALLLHLFVVDDVAVLPDIAKADLVRPFDWHDDPPATRPGPARPWSLGRT